MSKSLLSPIFTKSRITDDGVSFPDFNKEFIRSSVLQALKHQDVKDRIVDIFDECLNNNKFIKKIKGYSGEEIDTRLFKSFKYLFGIIITAVISTGIGFVFGFLIKGKV